MKRVKARIGPETAFMTIRGYITKVGFDKLYKKILQYHQMNCPGRKEKKKQSAYLSLSLSSPLPHPFFLGDYVVWLLLYSDLEFIFWIWTTYMSQYGADADLFWLSQV